ncbi:MAG: CDP-alcohol phosphatidyltransferase family protein [Acidimicrobiia bacterium]|nr:CDP-alcohol phosphatidyltransferase family protein [Acidimicrobiia bacterium]
MRSSKPSIAELRPIVHPPGLLARRSAEHWAGRWYMRRLSVYATWILVRTGLSANAVTGLMIVVGLVGAAAISTGGIAGAAAGVVLIQVYLLLDCSDGEVARWRETQSMTGVYLDRLGHYLVEASILVALGARAGSWDAPWLAAGLAAGMLVMLEKAETDLVDVARHRAGRSPALDESAVMRSPALARGRRLAGYLPLHRVTHAVEASLLILVAAVVSEATDSIRPTRALMVAMLAVTALTAVLHLVSVLSSSRLRDA